MTCCWFEGELINPNGAIANLKVPIGVGEPKYFFCSSDKGICVNAHLMSMTALVGSPPSITVFINFIWKMHKLKVEELLFIIVMVLVVILIFTLRYLIATRVVNNWLNICWMKLFCDSPSARVTTSVVKFTSTSPTFSLAFRWGEILVSLCPPIFVLRRIHDGLLIQRVVCSDQKKEGLQIADSLLHFDYLESSSFKIIGNSQRGNKLFVISTWEVTLHSNLRTSTLREVRL